MFADNLKQLRKDKGLTQTQFASEFNISAGTIAMWETGKRMPDTDMLKKIAQFFNVSIDYLLDNEKSPSITNEGLTENDEIIILNRNAKKLSPEQQKLLNDVVRQMLKEDFDD